MPLAIELAAAQAAYLAPNQIATLLDDRLTGLASRSRGIPDRQTTLAATVGWSVDLLDADEGTLFPRLSVFAGGFTLAAAQEIASGGMRRPLSDVLAGLVDKSLVLADTHDANEARYRLHEFVRQYAAALLRESEEGSSRQSRHAAWYCDQAEALDPEGGEAVVVEPSTWFAIERENLRVAMANALEQTPERALRAAVAAWRSWMASGMHAEGLQWLRRALAACPEVSPVHVRALFATAVFEVRLGRMEESVTLGRAIADIGRREDDPTRRAEAAHLHCLFTWLAAEWETIDQLLGAADANISTVPPAQAAHDHLRALVALSRGDSDAALSHLERSLHWLTAAPRDAKPLFAVCTLAFSVDQYDGLTMPILEETMLVGRRVGVAQAEAYVLCTIAFAARSARRYSEAAQALDRALRLFQSLSDRAGEAFALAQLGHLHRALGEIAAAISCFHQAADLRAADQRGTAMSLSGIALAEAGRGNVSTARGLASEAAQMLDRSGDRPGLSGALNNLAAIEIIAGRYGQAAQTVERLLALRAVPDFHRSVGWSHLLLAQLRERTGEHVRAEAARRAATAVFDQIGERLGMAAVESAARPAKRLPRPAKRLQSGGHLASWTYIGVDRRRPMTMTAALGDATVAELRSAVAGAVIVPGDPDYETARRTWNHAIDHRPAMIIRCTGTADVVAAVRFARSEGLPIAVRGGAHSVAGFSTCDDGLVLDLAQMRAVHVDPGAGRARAQGGTTWKQFDSETQLFGLATTGGLVSSTGLGGFTLGGGIGHLVRKYGLTCDNLISAEVVNADAQVMRVAADENPDLFWALRGGGGNFGVVTSLELAVHRVGPTVLGGAIFYPGDQAAQVISGWRDAITDAPDELTTTLNLIGAVPPLPFLPEAVHGSRVAVVIACYAGDLDIGEAAVAPLRRLGDPIADVLAPISLRRAAAARRPVMGSRSSELLHLCLLGRSPRSSRGHAC